MFSNSILQSINKKFLLLTDGDDLFVIGKRLITKKIELEDKVEEELFK